MQARCVWQPCMASSPVQRGSATKPTRLSRSEAVQVGEPLTLVVDHLLELFEISSNPAIGRRLLHDSLSQPSTRHAKIANSPMGRVDHAIPVGVEIGHVRVRQHHLHDHVKVNAQTPRQGPTRFGHRAPSSHREHIDHQKKHHNVRDVIDAILHLKTRQEKCITSALQDPIARLRSRHSCCLPESSHVFEVPVFWVCPQMLDDEQRSLNVKPLLM